MTACEFVTNEASVVAKEPGWFKRPGGGYKLDGRYESDLTAMDPVTFDIRKTVHLPYPNYAGALSTAGGLVFTALLDGTVAAFDDQTLEQLWRINLGAGFGAPPMTFEAGGKQ
jgi:alcohol dehydrogenase (cytochrome c)